MAFHLNTPSAVHYDEVLTNLVLSYMTEQSYIADRIFPVVDVAKQSDKFYKFNPDEENREGDVQKLAPRTSPPKFELGSDMDNYFAEVYGLAVDFDEQTLANADAVLDIRARKVSTAANKMLMKRDRDFLDTFFKTGVWGTDLAGTTDFVKWSDSASTPIDDLRTWKRAFQLRNYGLKANKLLIPQIAIDALMTNPQILGRINGGATVANPAMIDMTILANVFGVEEVVVLDTVTNTAKEGATGTPNWMAGDGMLLTHTPSNAGTDTPASGLIFAYNAIPGVSWGVSTESFTDDGLKRQGIAEEVQLKMAYDMKVVGEKLGTFINDVL
jgi:hypothetical protein